MLNSFPTPASRVLSFNTSNLPAPQLAPLAAPGIPATSSQSGERRWTATALDTPHLHGTSCLAAGWLCGLHPLHAEAWHKCHCYLRKSPSLPKFWPPRRENPVKTPQPQCQAVGKQLPVSGHPQPTSCYSHLSSRTLRPASRNPHTAAFILHPAIRNLHSASISLHPASFLLQPASRSLHPAAFILHPATCTPHSASFCILCSASRILQPSSCTLQPASCIQDLASHNRSLHPTSHSLYPAPCFPLLACGP